VPFLWIAHPSATPLDLSARLRARGMEAKALPHLAAGVAGLYGVVTRPEARGLGHARSLTIHAFSVARHQGYATGVLHSTPMARGLYEKIGCRAYADFRIFAPPRSLHL
jgi:ribosomal protein S18 acetylase RimI-like enzyme